MARRELEELMARVRAAPLAVETPSWRHVVTHAIGGLTEVGFGRGSDLLLVVSHDGRGLFDGVTGKRLARDDEAPGAWKDERELEARGIGALESERVRLAGLVGGGLAARTADGFHVERVAVDWPEEALLLLDPDARLHETASRRGRAPQFTKPPRQRGPRVRLLADGQEPRSRHDERPHAPRTGLRG